MANQFYRHEIVPTSPFLNQNFYLVWSFPGLATFTAAFASVASVVSPILASGASYISFYTAGSVPVGTFNISAYMVKGATGTFYTGTNIIIQDSEIAEHVATVYSIIKNNLGGTYASTLVTTGWYNRQLTRPQITVTSNTRTDDTWNLSDTFRRHEETVYVDTWVTSRQLGASMFGSTSLKRQRKLLDDEVKRIVNANRKAPSAKIRHMMIANSQPLDEVDDARKVFRTRHSLRLIWDETL